MNTKPEKEIFDNLNDLSERMDDIGRRLDIPQKEKNLRDFDKKITEEGFWDNPQEARQITQKRSTISKIVEHWMTFKKELEELKTLAELAQEDDQIAVELCGAMDNFESRFERYEFETLLDAPSDPADAIVAIHPGAGGTESQDWAQMLLRMYHRWAERRGFKFTLLDLLQGDEAGIKSATFEISGDYAYGYLKAEIGVHRLVRISPFDANSRRHTSFASVFVYPEIEEDIEIDINPSDIRVDVYRSSGPGGQGVNTTDSAVRITHEPTGIVVTCQNERSQHRNRDIAMKILKARLYDIKLREMDEERRKLESSKKEIAWGSQIRSYVLHPYRLIKDHRTNEETGKVDEVLDGDIDNFIEAYLRR
ncbi:peptide chain release factor 2 [bacterium]|nr:peptide chain release factor 2 [candidate division CSSED10-310 bacterium]